MAEWTDKEADIAMRMRENGYSNTVIGQMLGRSRSSVQTWFTRRAKPTWGGHGDKWTEEEEARLAEMRRAGVKAYIMAKELDRSYRSVVGKIRRMGFSEIQPNPQPVKAFEDGDREHVRRLLAYYAKREQAVAA